MSFCLLPKLTNQMKQAIIDGKLDPDKMVEMTSKERHDAISSVIGEDVAREVNALFESKLLLKNQQLGMINWVKKVSGLSESTKTDLFGKINKLEKALSPEDQKMFFKDLVDTKLGINVTEKEASKIAELSKNISIASKELDKGGVSDFGKAKVAMDNYMSSLKPETGGFGGKVSQVFSIQRAVQTGFDLSSALRQGAAYFGRKEWFGSVANAFKYLKSQESLDLFKAKMYSNPDWDLISKYKNNLGLTVLGQTFSTREEQFASRLIGKIPGLAQSERFYEGMLNDLRYNRFVNTLKARPDLKENPEALLNLAKVISSSTGRGDLSRVGLQSAANSLSTALFAPKFMISKLDQVIDPALRSGARMEAAKNLATTAGLFTAMAVGLKTAGVGVELDPRSSDFGKAKVGNTRVDLTFGFGPYIRVLSQLASDSTKSSITGKISQLNTGQFGAKTSFDVITNFLRGKESPIMSLLTDFMNRKDFGGNKLGVSGEAGKNSIKRLASMWEPLLGSDTLEAYKDASGQSQDFIPKDWSNIQGLKRGGLAGILSLVGVGVNTYGGTSDSISQTFDKNPFDKSVIKEFDRLQSTNNKPSISNPQDNTAWITVKNQFGEDKYNKATEDFQKQWNIGALKLIQSDKYKKESDDQKKKDLDKIKSYAEDIVLKAIGYKEPKTKVDTSGNNFLKSLVK